MLLNPNEEEILKDDLIEQIRSAFKGVTREHGISWSETLVIDNYGSAEDRTVAREQDTDKNWMEVALDPLWIPDRGIGGFAFLDIYGFRYYMAAAIMNYLVLGRDSDLEFMLYLHHDYFMPEQRLAVANSLRFKVQEDGRQYLIYRLEQEDLTYIEYVNSGTYWEPHMRSSWQDVLDVYTGS